MSITYVGTGTVNRTAAGVANTAVAPAYTGPALLILVTADESSTDTITTPTGWGLLTSSVNAPSVRAFWIYDATGAGVTIPAVTWTQASVAFVMVFQGTDINATAAFSAVDRAVNTTQNVGLPSVNRTPSKDGSLVIAVGVIDKLSAGSSTLSIPTSFTGGNFSTDAHGLPVDDYPAAAGLPVIAVGYWIQSTATIINANGVFTNGQTIANSAAFSSLFAILPGGTALAGAATAATSASGNLQAATGAASITAAASANLSTAIQAAGSALLSTAAVAALTNWATVTLSGTQYTGTGGIHDPNFWLDVDPPVGSTLYYDATNITIYPNGEISSSSNNCSAVVQFNDGTAWSIGLVILTPNMVTYATILAAAAGAMTTGIVMAGAALVAAQATGGLSTAVRLVGNALAIANAAAVLTTGLQLNAGATANVTATGALTGGTASLQAQATVLTTALGALTTKIQEAGQVIVDSQATGALSTQTVFQGAVTALTQANASLTTAVQLAGNANIAVTAAGAALIQSAFQGAANVLSSALGSLQTGLLIAGQALVTSTASGALSTGITLGGAAIVDVETSLAPVGLAGQFGYATIVVLSPTGLPVNLATFIEGSQCIVSVAYFNGVGAPFVPSGVRYQVNDLVSGLNLVPGALSAVPWTPIALPALSNAVTITGAKNSMVNFTRGSEEHEIVFEITDGVGNVSYESQVYALVRKVH